jgi:membrane associated rhomboid family serine protease
MSITLAIIILTSLISYQAFNDRGLFLKLKHYPRQESSSGEYYRMLTSGFVHANWLHLFVNMYVLWVFGEAVEYRFSIEFGEFFGRTLFLLVYLVTIILADLPTYVKHKDNPAFASVGASGAVSGIVFAFILFYPWSTLLLFFVIPMPAIVAGVLFLVYSSYASRQGQGNIDHDAHFFGAVTGFLLTLALKPSLFYQFINSLWQGLPF